MREPVVELRTRPPRRLQVYLQHLSIDKTDRNGYNSIIRLPPLLNSPAASMGSVRVDFGLFFGAASSVSLVLRLLRFQIAVALSGMAAMALPFPLSLPAILNSNSAVGSPSLAEQSSSSDVSSSSLPCGRGCSVGCCSPAAGAFSARGRGRGRGRGRAGTEKGPAS